MTAAQNEEMIMLEEWYEIKNFPGYYVSNLGSVQKPDGKLLVKSPVQYNTPTVGLRVAGDPTIHRRSVSRLVAEAFLPAPEREDFNTPICLDGDRANVRVDNLMWRPLWFAVNYHKDRAKDKYPGWKQDIRLVETGEVFGTPEEAAVKHGLLVDQIVVSVNNGDGVSPYGQHFEWASDL